MYNITFQQIEAFLTVAKYLNLSKAAESMFVTQPALSKTLQRFEEGIGMRLFERSNQGLKLTDEGKYLHSTLEVLYRKIDRAISAAKSMSSAQKTLRIVAPSSFDAAADFDRLKDCVRLYKCRHPDVVLMESLCDFRELRQAIELGDADLAFTQDFAISDLTDISHRRVSRFNLYVAMSTSHPLSSGESLDFEALGIGKDLYYTVPVRDDFSDVNGTLERCRRLGFMPRGIEFVPNFQTLLHNIRQGRGIGICGRFNYLGYDDIKYFPLPEEENRSYVVVAWRTGHLTREAEDFISLLEAECAQSAAP